MSILSNLTDADVRAICEIISAKPIKRLFETNSKEFAKIKPGFRAGSLSDKSAIDLLVKNKTKPFIFSYLDTVVSDWLKEIQSAKEQNESETNDYDQAIAMTLAGSVFCNEVALYFKLIGKDVTEEYIETIKDLMVKATSEEPNTDGSLQGSDSDGLRTQLDALTAELGSVKAQLAKTTELLTAANSELATTREHATEMKTAFDALNARIQYDDSAETELMSENEYEHVSICEVSDADYTGQKLLIRLADISRTGTLESFYYNEELPPYFGNRSKLFFRDGPNTSGTIGVWNWSATPNNNDHSRDYVITSFNDSVAPVEVITINGCECVKDIIAHLKNGIDADSSARRIMFSAYISKGQYIGVLCNKGEFESTANGMKLSDKVITLPQYNFSGKDITRLSNDRSYFRKLSVGIPVEVVPIKDKLEIVKSIIMSRNSWQTFKQAGGTRSEWKIVREFLEAMDTSLIISDIEESAMCSHSDAEALLQQFMDTADQYIDGASLEDSVISSVIAVNQELMSRCKELVRASWESENQEELNAAQDALAQLQTAIETAKASLEKQLSDNKKLTDQQLAAASAQLKSITGTHTRLSAELSAISDQIEAKKKLADDVDMEVAERIRKAQDSAAEFIATMAFVSPIASRATPDAIPLLSDAATKVTLHSETGYKHGEALPADEIEKVTDWKLVLEVLSAELVEAGIAAKYSKPLAAYMYSAYERHIPLMFAGPNASEIVDALSVSLFARTAGLLECTENYNEQLIVDCTSNVDNVIRISNAFSSAWITRVPDIIRNKERYFCIVHPYAEDIQIEPKSLFSYVLPVFTEVLVDNVPTGSMCGGLMPDTFLGYGSRKITKSHKKLLSELKATPLMINTIQAILSDMHGMLNDSNADWDVLFALLPYAVASLQYPSLLGAIKNPENSKLQLSGETKALITSLYGDEE